MGLKVISLPAISSGIFGYPFDKACDVYSKAINDFSKNAKSLKEIRFCFLEKRRALEFSRKF